MVEVATELGKTSLLDVAWTAGQILSKRGTAAWDAVSRRAVQRGTSAVRCCRGGQEDGQQERYDRNPSETRSFQASWSAFSGSFHMDFGPTLLWCFDNSAFFGSPQWFARGNFQLGPNHIETTITACI